MLKEAWDMTATRDSVDEVEWASHPARNIQFTNHNTMANHDNQKMKIAMTASWLEEVASNGGGLTSRHLERGSSSHGGRTL